MRVLGVRDLTRATAKTKKGEETRARIVEAALDLFREHGYDATTMRSVADRAEVSLGNAYYYYKSKEHLLHAYYERMSQDHDAAVENAIEGVLDLEQRVGRALLAKLDVIEPYHRFAGLLFKTAADPKSPLNPFHPNSADVRVREVELFGRVLNESKTRVPKSLKEHLPSILWLHSMGIVLFWIHDDSPNRERTRALIRHSARMIARLIKLLSNPLLRPFRTSLLQMLRDMQFAAVPAVDGASDGD